MSSISEGRSTPFANNNTSVAAAASQPSLTIYEDDAQELEELFGNIDWNQANIVDLERQWREEMAVIERENVKALMQSSEKSQQLLPYIQKAISELMVVDGFLEEYSEKLRVMSQEIQQIEELNCGLKLQSENQKILLAHLEKLIAQINLPEDVLRILENEPLENPTSIHRIEDAGHQLQTVLSHKFEHGLQKIKAVAERLKYFASAHERFSQRLARFFLAEFAKAEAKVAALRSKQGKRVGSLKLTSLESMYPFLQNYRGLLHLLLEMSPPKHLEGYQNASKELFTEELFEITETLKTYNLLKRTAEDRPYLFNCSVQSSNITGMLNLQITSKQSGQQPSSRDLSSLALLDSETLPDIGSNEILAPNQILNYLILTIYSYVVRQQAIVAEFFYAVDPHYDYLDLKVIKKVESMLETLFEGIDEIPRNFFESILRADPSAAIELLVVIDYRLPQFINDLPMMANILVEWKNLFLHYAESFLADQVQAIKEYRMSTRKRSGVFPFVTNFPVQNFVVYFEGLVSKADPASSAREFVTKSYETVSRAIFDALDGLSEEAQRSNDEKEHINAYVMTIQNTHQLLLEVRSLKMFSLEHVSRMAREEYDLHIASYASLSLSRVFGRLQEFFAEIDSLLRTTPAEEIAFHTNFNKANARKVIAAFPLKEIRRNVELLYARVQKHFGSGDSSLVQVIWRAIQEQFLHECEIMTQTIVKVYPNSDVQLGFTVSDAIGIFSEVVRG